jgi:hypothetical protein
MLCKIQSKTEVAGTWHVTAKHATLLKGKERERRIWSELMTRTPGAAMDRDLGPNRRYQAERTRESRCESAGGQDRSKSSASEAG